MARPPYLDKYIFDWELFDVVAGGLSALDTKFFMGRVYSEDRVNGFLKGYGIDPSDPVSQAELFGNFQEAIQFIRRYFLKEGNPDGLDLKIPNLLYSLTDISELILLVTGHYKKKSTHEERLWAEAILKVMHTILHADKDITANYFSVIQTQVFDRFYKHLTREGDRLYLGAQDDPSKILLVEFNTKSKKGRDSVIIKLLHKAENVAEEVFDRIGVRFVTQSRFDSLRVVKHLIAHNIVIPHNVKPSRSINTLIDISGFRKRYFGILKKAIRANMSEADFLKMLDVEIEDLSLRSKGASKRNNHTKEGYQSLQFTCRQLIKYKNPFMSEFSRLREIAKKTDQKDDLAKRILAMDVSLVARNTRFFYPYEVQVVDIGAHKMNSEGEASHAEYKKAQTLSAMRRVFCYLIAYKNLNI